jgi:hypothetical protein
LSKADQHTQDRKFPSIQIQVIQFTMRLSTITAVFLSTAVMAAPADVKREAEPEVQNYGSYGKCNKPRK